MFPGAEKMAFCISLLLPQGSTPCSTAGGNLIVQILGSQPKRSRNGDCGLDEQNDFILSTTTANSRNNAVDLYGKYAFTCISSIHFKHNSS